MSNELTLKINRDKGVNERIKSNYLMSLTNPKLPASFKRGNRITGKPKYIIIHDSNCLNHTDAALITMTQQPSIGSLKSNTIIKDGDMDYNYHYILDKIGEDYEIIAGRPINMRCDYPDLDSSYADSMHVIILCDLNVDMPDNRMYKVLAYRCLAPLLKMLKISSDPSSAIVFHNELQTKRNNLKCPGDFLAKELLVSQVRRYM